MVDPPPKAPPEPEPPPDPEPGLPVETPLDPPPVEVDELSAPPDPKPALCSTLPPPLDAEEHAHSPTRAMALNPKFRMPHA
jgi:hypothetical protein